MYAVNTILNSSRNWSFGYPPVTNRHGNPVESSSLIDSVLHVCTNDFFLTPESHLGMFLHRVHTQKNLCILKTCAGLFFSQRDTWLGISK